MRAFDGDRSPVNKSTNVVLPHPESPVIAIEAEIYFKINIFKINLLVS